MPNEKKPKTKYVEYLRHAEYYDMQSTFDELYARSQAGEIFDGLMDVILSRENILLAYRNIKSNTGSFTPGTDKLTVVNLVVQLVAAMLLALALNQKLKGRSVYRTLILVPWAVPHAIAAMTFTFLYNANVGIINILAVKLGMITESVSWLGNVGSAFWCVILTAIWKGIPFQMIFILAALQGISGDVYESAEIDGASRWQCFWRITLPIIKEPLAISTILNLIGIVSCFNTIWLMTKGGPLYSTEIVYTYAYRRAFIDHNFGTAAAASVVLFVFMAVFSGVYLKMVSEKE